MTIDAGTRRVGWLFVAVQALLLVGLVVLPSADHWPVANWMRVLTTGMFFLGLGIVGVGAIGLGAAATPTPVPTEAGQLRTGGLYGHVRHPIYSGVLLIVAAITIRSGSMATVAMAIFLIIFFTVKARWEEQRLADRYDEYAAYAARTPRFVPHPWRRR